MKILGISIGRKASRTWSGIIQTGMNQAVWTPTDYSALSKAGYEKCMTAYSCVKLIATTAAGIEWKLIRHPRDSRGKVEEMDASHPLLQLIRHPNKLKKISKRKLFETNTAFLLLSGNNYIKASGPMTGANKGQPLVLDPLFPDRVRVLPGDRLDPIAGYEHRVGAGKPDVYEPEEVLHTKLFHPNDEVYGLSPISVAAMGVDLLNMSTEWNMRLLQNDGRPPFAINVKAGFNTQEKKDLFEKAIMESYLGYKNAGKPVITEGEVDWKQLSITPHDMDWLNADKTTVQKVCAVFNVAPELFGYAEKKYGNMKEARSGLYLDAVLPIMQIFRDDFNMWLTPQYGDRLELTLNLDKIEALKEDRKTLFSYVSTADWLSDNEKREMTGHEGYAGGDVVYKPINLVPVSVGSKGSKSVPLIHHKQLDNKSFWATPERKRLLWDSYVARVEAKEKPAITLAEEFLNSQAANVKQAASKLATLSGLLPEALIDVEAENKRYLKKTFGWYMDAFEKAGEAGMVISKGQLYTLEQKDTDFFNLTPELEAELRALVIESAEWINLFTRELIFDIIQLSKGSDWTVQMFAQEIWKKLDSFTPARALRVARTETAMVENMGQHEGYGQSEFVNARGWASIFIDTTRQTHMDADAQYSNNPLELEEPFIVGGYKMMFPGDRSFGAPAGEVINCLCTTFPHVRG